MNLPIADDLRFLVKIHGDRHRHECLGQAADLLKAIDALHQPYSDEYDFVGCETCGPYTAAWPCPTARLLHPEAGGS